MLRMELTAEPSLAAIRARNRLGIAIAAMTKMIATTIKSSISEKPLFDRIVFSSLIPKPDAINVRSATFTYPHLKGHPPRPRLTDVTTVTLVFSLLSTANCQMGPTLAPTLTDRVDAVDKFPCTV